ncbi:conserved hypothetical protein [Desulfofarcimen acetoxidans DSM 771]|uniref:Uncharacterized protein n=1 Tax=Desulfofarcimen acetoxidans (strain ATCC 49208 / DSM 771 / KCTC 5769 / VKM B-1644 / 5575) TaxID=485916 RepID=C8W5U8_DESAS|nr:hypothetical protein [Desulfofarcimen acetoxidans]ACV64098.1 conserved hypothetical protein [Desulfofarcimen acetoxidans DSM 771]
MEKAMLFVREQSKLRSNGENPSFIYEGSVGTDLRINFKHIRKIEIEQIAKLIGAEVVYLKASQNDEENKDSASSWYYKLFWNI